MNSNYKIMPHGATYKDSEGKEFPKITLFVVGDHNNYTSHYVIVNGEDWEDCAAVCGTNPIEKWSPRPAIAKVCKNCSSLYQEDMNKYKIHTPKLTREFINKILPVEGNTFPYERKLSK